MRRRIIAAVVLAGCGRINFDPLSGRQDARPGDDGSPAGMDAAVCGGGGGVWNDGDEVTYSQLGWSDDPNAITLLDASFGTVYAASSGIAEVGVPGGSGFSMQFTSPGAVKMYLPASGPAAALTADLVDPLSGPAGAFGGDVLALQLDVDFADAGITTGTAAVRFGDLVLCGFTTLPAVDGMTVRQFAALVNMQLGGASSTLAISGTAPITSQLAGAFPGGTACMFAAQHLVSGLCP